MTVRQILKTRVHIEVCCHNSSIFPPKNNKEWDEGEKTEEGDRAANTVCLIKKNIYICTLVKWLTWGGRVKKVEV